MAAALDRWGHIDVLHNNVGIGTGDGDAQSLDTAGWDRIVDVNLRGTWLMCRHAVPSMRDRGAGAIVNVSSIAAVCASPLLAYKVSKAGVNALTHQLAMDNARHGVRVNAVMPGLIDTPMAVDGIAEAFGLDPEDVRPAGTGSSRSGPTRAPPGTSPTPPCSWPRTRPASSRAPSCPWTGGRADGSADRSAQQRLGDDHPLDLVGALVDLGARFRRSSWLPPVC